MGLEEANYYAGLVSLGTFVLLVVDPKLPARTYGAFLDAMVVLDAVAFLFFYISDGGYSNCTAYSLRVVADVLWCFKDACKYAYITDHTLELCAVGIKHLDAAVFAVSSVLYSVYIIYAYVPSPCFARPGIADTWALLLLYGFWFLVSVSTTALLIARIWGLLATRSRLLGPSSRQLGAKLVNGARVLFIGCVLTTLASVMAVARLLGTLDGGVQINALLFVYTQCLLYISHERCELGELRELRESG